MSIALDIYHRLPSWARGMAASAHGFKLKRRRYDKQTEKLVEKALEREFWDDKQWNAWQENQLSFVLHRAATKVPFYRNHWAERRRKGDKSSWEYLENWSVLEKQTVRDRITEFVADDCDRSKMFPDNTSGTTGTSLDIWSKPETVKYWYALFEARWRNWYGVSRHDKWAIIGGQLITPFNQKKPPFWVWNAGLKQLYLSAYHLSPDHIKYYIDALVKYRVEYIFGYSAALYSLAQEIVRQGRNDIRMKVAITNAEPLYDYQREVIEAGFNCPVRETYGMAEMVAAAGECEKGKLHIWKDAGIIEIEAGSEDQTGAGNLICTGLVNADMPFIKYQVGDYGQLSEENCTCGRNLSLLKGIDGRSDDVLFSSDGRPCSHLHLVLNGNLPVFEAQIIQQSLEEVLVKYIPAPEFDRKTAETLTEKICNRMGNINVIFEEVTEIPRSNRGKFRAVVCDLSKEERNIISNNLKK